MIQEYLTKYGWSFDVMEDNLVLVSFTGASGRLIPFLISENEDIFSFMASFRRKAVDIQPDLQTLLLLMRMNNSWPFIKIGISDALDTYTLSLESMRNSCTFETFQTLMDIFVEGLEMFLEPMMDLIEEAE
jgi:hypothetical protein